MVKTLISFLRSWAFPLAFIALIGFATEQSLKKVSEEKLALQTQLDKLNTEQQAALQAQSLLRKQLNSQSDPAWIELVLKRELGLIPEGETKVHFTPSS